MGDLEKLLDMKGRTRSPGALELRIDAIYFAEESASNFRTAYWQSRMSLLCFVTSLEIRSISRIVHHLLFPLASRRLVKRNENR